jgi:hypothetical protein
MDAEQIVRALAAERPPVDVDGEMSQCLLCGADDRDDQPLYRQVKAGHYGADGGWYVGEYEDVVESHAPGCLWRLAREWVAGHGD